MLRAVEREEDVGCLAELEDERRGGGALVELLGEAVGVLGALGLAG